MTKPSRRFSFWCLTCCLLLSYHAIASAQYQFDSWNTDNGLPQNSVNAILQTKNGYLWLATSDGLVRYDGVRFSVFNKGNTNGILSNRFSTLFEDREGSLWAGTEDAGLTRYHNGTFNTYAANEGIPEPWIWWLGEDLQGRLLVVCQHSITRFEGERYVPYVPEGGVTPRIPSFFRRAAGLSFLAVDGVHRFEGGGFKIYPLPDGLPVSEFNHISQARDGSIWTASKDGRLHHLKENTWQSYPLGIPGQTIEAVHEDRAGGIWVGAVGAGLNYFKDGRLTKFAAAQGFNGQRATIIYEDHEGTIWLGTPSNGLFRARRQAISVYSEADGLSNNNVYTIYEGRDGSVWFGTWRGGLNRLKDGRFTHYTAKDGLSGDLVTALYEDRDGALWVGTHDHDLNRFKDGRFAVYTRADGLGDKGVLAIQQDRKGALWIGTQGGLNKYHDGGFTLYTTREGLGHNWVQIIYEDREGALWLGTKGGLSRLKDEQFISYTERDGLASNNVRAIYEDQDGVLWVGTYDGGLSRLKDGRFTRYTTNEGLFNNGVFQILDDGRGYFWMSCNLGIYRVSRRELEDFAAGKIRRITSIAYGRKDGLIGVECNGGRQPAGWKTRDGRLWFPMQQGVAVLDPTAIPINQQPPPVQIERVLLNDRPVAASGTLEIHPGEGNLEIDYTGLSFINPEQVKFKYKLDGLDADWVDAGPQRVAYYRHLPPGNYTFTVIAANRDGVWNTTGAALRLIVHPPFWRTWWFISFTSLALAGIVVLAYRRHVAKLKRAHTMQEAFSRQLIASQEAERQRIAAELHDQLGQNLLIIKNYALLGLDGPNGDGPAAERFDEISTTASQALDEVRAIAHNLRPYQLDRLGLTRALESIVQTAADSSGIALEAELDKVDGIFDEEAEINLYRIVQESINNIIKHSGAKHARLIVQRAGRAVEVKIEDDGQGFNPELILGSNAARHGFGLLGINERARILGTSPVIRTVPGRGTSITLTIAINSNHEN